MLAYLSPDWLGRAAEAVEGDVALNAAVRAAIRDGGSDPGVTVRYVVLEAPGPAAGGKGEINYEIRFSSSGVTFTGSASESSFASASDSATLPGDSAPPGGEDTVVLTLDYQTASAIHKGELDPAVAMALARVHVRGAAGKLVPLQDALSRLPAALAALRPDTTY